MDNQLDPQALALAKAIRRTETGGHKDPYNARGASGEFGAFQFMPATYKSLAQKHLGNANAAPTVENQNKIVYSEIKKLKDQGYNPAQIASIWNSGNPDRYKTGGVGVNKYGVSYNVPQYVSKVSQNYKALIGTVQPVQQKAPEQPVEPTIEQQKQERIAQGLPVSVREDRAEPTAVGGIIREIVKQPLKAALSVARPIAGYSKGVSVDTNYLGNVGDYGTEIQKDTQQLVQKYKQGDISLGRAAIGGIGAGAKQAMDLASIVPVGQVGSIAKGGIAAKTAIPTLKTAARESLIRGGAIGAGYDISGQLASGEQYKPMQTVGAAALGTAVDFGLTKALPEGVEFGKKKFSQSPEYVDARMNDIVEKKMKDIFDIENSYTKTRKAMDYAKDANANARRRVAETDVLVGSVDDTGTIRTKQPGGAVDKYTQQTIEGKESVVRDLLEREGASITPQDLQKKLISAIDNDRMLQGKARTKALNDVIDEVAAYPLNENGTIPLSSVHDAKIATTKIIKDFATPVEYKTYQKSLARGLKEAIEENSSEEIRKINNELAEYYKDIRLLESLDGKKVKGGKLGKYFSQISGNIIGGIAGNAVGGPVGSAVGTIVGGEVGGRIRGNTFTKTFGKLTGGKARGSDILTKATVKSKSPKLPPGLPSGRGPSENFSPPRLPAPKQNIFEPRAKVVGYSNSDGNLNQRYNSTATASKTGISKVSRETPKKSITKQVVKTEPKALPKSKVRSNSIQSYSNFDDIPDGTTDVRGMVFKKGDKIFPTEKLDTEMLNRSKIDLNKDGSIKEQFTYNKSLFLDDLNTKGSGKVNKPKRIISEESYQKALKNLGDTSTLNSTPIHLSKDALIVAGYHIENGVRSAAELGIELAKKGYKFTKEQLEELFNKANKNVEIEPLIQEAKKYKSAEEFVKAFTQDIKRGQYWHITEDPNFKIDLSKGPRDMSSISGGGIDVGKLMVTSDLPYWAENYKGSRKYVAKIDMSNVPNSDFWQTERGMGNEFFVNLPEKARVEKVIPLEQGLKESVKFKKWLEKNITNKSQLEDIWKKANKSPLPKAKKVSNDIYKGEKDLTTKILKDLEGKTTVSKQYILDATNRPELKQSERDLIRSVLQGEGDTIKVKDFANKVKVELLPLKVKDIANISMPKEVEKALKLAEKTNLASDWEDYRIMKRLYGDMGTIKTDPKYENVSLPDELRGSVKNYKENIYESPVKTSAGEAHFRGDTDNYFGHTRIEDMADNKTRRVIEVQSDLYQKGNLEREYSAEKRGLYDLANKPKQAIDDLNRKIAEGENGLQTLGFKPEQYDTLTEQQVRDAVRTSDPKYLKSDQNYFAKQFKEYKKAKADIDNAISNRANEVNKLQQYNNPTAHFRMVREEIKKAAQDGKTKLQFPTGETAMKIEGLGVNTQWYELGSDGYASWELSPEKLEIGKSVTTGNDNNWIITDVIGDGKFKAVPKDKWDDMDAGVFLYSQEEKRLDELWRRNQTTLTKEEIAERDALFEKADQLKASFQFNRDIPDTETFDISGKVDTNNPIYKFYEKDLQKYLQKFDGKRVTDENGVEWIEVPIKKEYGKMPVEAFAFAPLGLTGLPQKKENKKTGLPTRK